MAWNPSPEVAVARDVAAKLGNVDQVIIITLNYAKNQLGLVTYGKTRKLCDAAKVLGDEAYKAVYSKMAGNDEE